MALRPPVGIALALVVGVTLGYSVRPAAQGRQFVGDSRLIVEPAGAGRVRVVVTSKSDAPSYEADRFELHLSGRGLSASGTTTTVDPVSGVTQVSVAGFILQLPGR